MAFSKGDWYSPAPLWHNGPAPVASYHFPGKSTGNSSGFIERSKAPITTGSSVLAVKFDNGVEKGVVIAADTLGSYGSLARFRDCPRLFKVNKQTIVGAGGDYADFQYLKSIVEQKNIDDECLDDGFVMKPKSLYCWLTNVLYNRRSRLDPFWNNFIVAGIQDGEPYLGTVDKLGTAYEENLIATGLGQMMAVPLLREAVDKKPNMSRLEAQNLLVKCLEVLFYRDARSFPRYQLGVVTADGATISEPLNVESKWDVATFLKPY